MHDHIPARRNRAIAMVLMGLNLWQFLFLPLLLWSELLSPVWLWTLAVCALTTPPLWYLIHEAFHHGFSPDRDENDTWGHALAMTFGGPYELLRFGHMMHHRFNGAVYDRPDLYDPDRTSRIRAWAGYYFQLLGGFYLQELLSFFIFFTSPRRIERTIDRMLDRDDPVEGQVATVARKTFLAPSLRVVLQRDGLAVYATLLISLLLYGQAGLWYMPLIILAVRALLVSLANNLPHYGTAGDDVRFGHNLRMPRWLGALLLNFNHHRTHHHHPNLPWSRLPDRTRQDGEQLEMPVMRALLAQFAGPRPAPSRPDA